MSSEYAKAIAYALNKDFSDPDKLLKALKNAAILTIKLQAHKEEHGAVSRTIYEELEKVSTDLFMDAMCQLTDGFEQ